MGPGLWLSSLPLHSSEVPERHLSDLNWKDGAMHSERNLDSGEIEGARQRGRGEEKAREAVVRRNHPFVLSVPQQSEMLKVDFPPELMRARCE